VISPSTKLGADPERSRRVSYQNSANSNYLHEGATQSRSRVESYARRRATILQPARRSQQPGAGYSGLRQRRRAAGVPSCSRFAPWKISFSGACLRIAPAVGVRRRPVSRLFSVGVGHYADSVLIAAGDRNTCKADLEPSRITALKGRCDATPPARRVSLSPDLPPEGGSHSFKKSHRGQFCAAARPRQFPGAMRPGRCVSSKNHAAGVPIRGGAVSTMAVGLPECANDCWLPFEKPEPTRTS
jgi:hypothetical protein